MSNSYIYRPLLFKQETLKRLQEKDFSITNREKICLQYADCIIVLFHDDSKESEALGNILKEISIKTVGPSYATCNLNVEKRVAEGFTSLKEDLNHPFHWCQSATVPFMLIYRGGWPCSFYNEKITVNSVMNQVCLSSYREQEYKPYVEQQSIKLASFSKPINGLATRNSAFL